MLSACQLASEEFSDRDKQSDGPSKKVSTNIYVIESLNDERAILASLRNHFPVGSREIVEDCPDRFPPTFPPQIANEPREPMVGDRLVVNFIEQVGEGDSMIAV
jgi:hypothetical protein